MRNDDALKPTSPGERIETVDVLRGFALCGILVVNIQFFLLPSCAFFDPRVAGGFEGIHLLTWKLISIFFFQKMMGIFSMLFGAGLILMDARARAQGKPLRGVYYRRVLWLLLFGMIHGYLIWYGDILYSYALIGLVLYLFRNRSPKQLIVLSLALLMLGSLLQWGSGFFLDRLRNAATELAALERSGEELTDQQRAWIELWQGFRVLFAPGPEEVAAAEAAYRGGYLDNLSHRISETFTMQTWSFLFYDFWHAGSMMLLGMGLMKAGFLAGKLPTRAYVTTLVAGYVIGLPLCAWRAEGLIAHDFDIVYRFQEAYHLNFWGSVLVALAYVSTLVLVVRRGLWRGLTDRLAAVGRMALSNYLMHSLLCSAIFYGCGLGLFNRLGRFWPLPIAIAICGAQLAISPMWLRRFRFGPAEWLWRSLTYRRLQPMRLSLRLENPPRQATG